MYYDDKDYSNYINLDFREMYTKSLTSRLKKSLETRETAYHRAVSERGH